MNIKKKNFVLIITEKHSGNLEILPNIFDTGLKDDFSYLILDYDSNLVQLMEQHQPDCLLLVGDAASCISNMDNGILGHTAPILILYHYSDTLSYHTDTIPVQYLPYQDVLSSADLLRHSLHNIISCYGREKMLEKQSQKYHKDMILHQETNNNLKTSHKQLQEANNKANFLYNNLLEAKDKIEQAKTEADCANNSKTLFLAKMSHDLRTPLNAIINFSDIIRKEAFGPLNNLKYKEYSQDIHCSSLYLLNLIDELLDISKIEHDEIKLNYTHFDIEYIIKECIRNIQIDIDAKQIRYQLFYHQSNVRVAADAIRIKQVLINILSNAIKHMPPEGRLSIQVTIKTKLNIIIKDTGCGISKEHIQHLFKPYYQVEPKDNRSNGSGLGLYISKKIIEAHQGQLTIHSKEGHGTSVYITLPREMPEHATERICA